MRRAARLARDECPSPRFAARYRTRLTGLVTRYGRREGDPFAPASNSSEAVVLEPSLAPRVAQPRALASGSQTSARPPAKPKALKPIDSRATLPVRMIKVGPGNLAAIFLLIGHRRRRALSRFALSASCSMAQYAAGRRRRRRGRR